MRLCWIDNLRALLILLVVLGHIIQFTHPAYGDTLPFQYIYSFHMPLFVFVSGFVSGVYRRGVKKRFFQLIIPFLVFAVFLAIEKGDIGECVELIVYPEKSLWFLWALFFIILFHQIGIMFSKKLRVIEIVVQAFMWCVLLSAGSKLTLFGVPIVAKFFFYYCLAYYTAPLVMRVERDKKTVFLTMSLMIIFLVSTYWCKYPVPTFHLLGNPVLNAAFIKVFQIGVALLGISTFMLLVRFFFDHQYAGLSSLGAHDTLGIYALHTLLLNLPVVQAYMHYLYKVTSGNAVGYWSLVFLHSTLILFLCILIIRVIRKSKMLSIIFLGENRLFDLNKQKNT